MTEMGGGAQAPRKVLGLTGYQWLALLLCAFTFLIEGYDMGAVSLAAPTIAQHWGVKATQLGTAIVALNIGAVFGNGFLAPIGDRTSRKWTIVASTLVLGAGVLLTATATSVGQLITWRLASGLAYGVATANVVALIAEQFPRNRRALLVVIAATNLSLGSALGGFTAAPVITAFGWRGLFLIGGTAGVVLSIAIALAIRASPPPDDEGQRVRLRGGAAKVPILRLFEPGLIDVTLPLWLIGFCNAAVLFVMLNWLPTMLTNSGWTLAEATRAPAMVSIGGIVSGITFAMMVDSGHAAGALRVAFSCLVVMMALFVIVPPSVLVWTAMLLVAGVMCSGAHHVERALYATLYPSAVRSTGVGWGNMMSRLGNIIGTLIVALLIDLDLGVGNTLGLLVAPATVALLCTFPLGRAYARRRAEESAALSNEVTTHA